MNDPHLLATVDRYIENLFVPADPALETALRDAAAAGLPEIQVSPNEGKLLHLLAKLSGASRILEIGLLGGYSAIWLARALPQHGRLVSLEIEARYAEVARRNLDRAGLLDKVDIRVAPALVSLERLVQDHVPAFDLVFIDADKVTYPAYLDWALRLVRPGSLILADNVIRHGAVTDPNATDPAVRAIQEFNRRVAHDPRLEAVLIPIMREAIDGLAIARVKE